MKKFNNILSKIEQYFIGILLLIIAFMLFINVLLRFLGSSLVWSEEVARYSIVWVTFIGSSVCIYKGAHIGVDAIMNILSDRGKKILTIITILISIVFTIIFTYLSFIIIKNVLITNQESSTIKIPMVYVYGAMPVGGILMLLRYTQEFVLKLKDGENK
ncbi:TRAP transporter small permease [Tissierella sp. MB52-C2]|uniref:TRAP transporter small permease n=1 Tax=Tissierella sp. MB52-C2 TaxID=3070999 RepID=UPI00280B715E|nr:TRAP transporter small permease [Tissierella sp. MB52-C2]WMM24872.1 TRAP transporter small permease [Tissierella sp. MB52-C2]